MKRFFIAVFVCCFGVMALPKSPLNAKSSLYAESQVIQNIRVEGNAKVESEAILNLLSTQKGTSVVQSKVRDDIRSLYQLGYLSEIKVFKEPSGPGIDLVIQA